MTLNVNQVFISMIRNRIYQHLIKEKIREKKFLVPIHLAMGHEAIATAIKFSCINIDSIFCTHRNLHYNVAFSKSFLSEYNELILSKDSNSQGKLGSMNLFDPNTPIKYSSSILGNNLAIACGYAFSNKSDNNSIVYAVTGDGAIEEGIFYEALLFAKSMGLKIIFIVENNSWSLATKIIERRSPIDLKKLSDSFDIGYTNLKTNDVVEYVNAINLARNHVVTQSLPHIIEVNLSTLGYMYTEEGRCINYHAGLAKNISLSVDDVILSRKDNEDPLYILSKFIGSEAFEILVSDIFKEENLVPR